jgi:deoxyadenosine/deoxycytidine kinase
MWFALTKYHDIGKYDDDTKIYIHDQGVINNNAYTNMFFKDEFDEEARELIQQTFDYTENWFGFPDLVLHLQCDLDKQLEQIRERDRDYEKDIDIDFIRAWDEELNELLKAREHLGYRIMEIDVTDIDFKTDRDFKDRLWSELKDIQIGMRASLLKPGIMI